MSRTEAPQMIATENEILSYTEMCQREHLSLQQGMNFGRFGRTSVILMSVRHNAPYRDRLEDNGTTLIYEGHDVPKTGLILNPKVIDQLEVTPAGTLTQNGLFYRAAQGYKRGERTAEGVRVYEKIRPGIWSSNGLFRLVDAWKESDGARRVFKFRLVASNDADITSASPSPPPAPHRIIPTSVKLEVWKRDKGRCVQCGATDELHFDHVLPFSRGGTSITAANVQLLCARHNLLKRDRIL